MAASLGSTEICYGTGNIHHMWGVSQQCKWEIIFSYKLQFESLEHF